MPCNGNVFIFIQHLKRMAVQWPGRLVVMGLSFFIYIICASYTANLAIFLTRIATATTGINSILDVRSLGAKFCVLESLAETYQNNVHFPIQADDMLTFDEYGAMFEGLEAGMCLAAVAGDNEFRVYIEGSAAQYTVCRSPDDLDGYSICSNSSEPASLVNMSSLAGPDYGKFCNLVQIKDTSFNEGLSWAFPVAQLMEPTLSAWLVEAEFLGATKAARQTQLIDRVPAVCPRKKTDSTNPTAQPQLGVTDLGGLYFYSVTVITAGLVFHLTQIVRGQENIFWPARPAICGGQPNRVMVSGSTRSHTSQLNVESNGSRNNLVDTVPVRHGWFSCLDAEKEVEIEAHEEVEELRSALRMLDTSLGTLATNMTVQRRRGSNSTSFHSQKVLNSISGTFPSQVLVQDGKT